MAKQIITESDVIQAVASGLKALAAPAGCCIVTDQARDRALELGLELAGGQPEACPEAPGPAPAVDAAPGLETLVRQVMASVSGRLPSGVDPQAAERVVREVAAARLAAQASPPGDARRSGPGGVRLISGAKALGSGPSSIPAGDRALVAEVLGGPGESGLAAGFLAWEKTSFPRQVESSEVAVVVEGELHLIVDGQTLVARTGDMVCLPQGAQVVLGTPSRVKLACVTMAR